MTRNEMREILLTKGFKFKKSQNGFPSRGDEDVYTHPDYKYNFYVTRIRKSDPNSYGFFTGDRNAEALTVLVPRNTEDNFRKDKRLEMWSDKTFLELMKHFD